MTRLRDVDVDVAVVGAGPAGLAAAAETTRAGLRTCLVDNGPRLGGQYWRHRATGIEADRDLHHGVARFARLRETLAAGGELVTVLTGQQVWSASTESGCTLLTAPVDGRADGAVRVRSAYLVIAAGAVERQVPFPGWDLPGVMGAGAAQALLKGSGVAVGPRAVVAGTGPFLLPVAVGLARRGVEVLGVHEAASPARWRHHAWSVARRPGKVAEAAGYLAELTRHGVRVRSRSVVLAAHGTDRVEAVTTGRTTPAGDVEPGSERRIATDVLAVGWGFDPQTDLAALVGCARRSGPDGRAVVTVDEEQRTSVPDIWAAGEVTGVGGARLAATEGEIAGRSIAHAAGLGAAPGAALARRARSDRVFGTALAEVYAEPAGWPGRLRPDTVVCRCEEVTYRDLRRAVELGAGDQRSAKLLSRAGMGLCQGRSCGPAVAVLLARRLRGAPLAPDPDDRRPVLHPVRLDEVAALSPHTDGTERGD